MARVISKPSGTRSIREMSISEREEMMLTLARRLEGSAREAFLEGQTQIASRSERMAEKLMREADELARDDIAEAGRLVDEALGLLHVFRQSFPHRWQSQSIH